MEKTKIKAILLEQKEEITEIFKQKIIRREAEARAKRMLKGPLVKVIMGVRRSGKSVLAHQLLQGDSYGYVNFDDERLVKVGAGDLNDFLEVLQEIEPGVKTLFLDEIQNVEGWELFVNRLLRKRYNLVVSGSNAKLLSRELATHLTGRHLSLELYPFSFKEFLDFNNVTFEERDFAITEKRASIKNLLEQYLNWGGFPEVYQTAMKENYLRELFSKIVMRDIILRYGIKYGRDLKEIALYAASNCAARFTYHKIRNLFEVKSVHTIKNYLDYLQESYLIFQLHPFSFKLKEQLRQPRKLYGIDNAMMRAMAPSFTQDRGKWIENLVLLEWKRRGEEIYFYSQGNYEIDFVIRKGTRINQLLQVSYSLEDRDTRKREVQSLLHASKKLHCENLAIVTWDTEAEEKVGPAKIKIVPLWKWLLTGITNTPQTLRRFPALERKTGV
ncbi:MAG: ATP-binding protein [Deltaproteobacteria bacterium]|nr:ATP-binding protein [Deltaproteobacteria bacterium]